VHPRDAEVEEDARVRKEAVRLEERVARRREVIVVRLVDSAKERRPGVCTGVTGVGGASRR